MNQILIDAKDFFFENIWHMSVLSFPSKFTPLSI